MENKRILVIGGSGYIGQAIVDVFNKQNFEITVLSRNPKNRLVARIKYLKGDVLNKTFLSKNLKNFDIIIYLAAITRTLNKKKYEENIIGLDNTLKIVRENKIKKFLYFSTQSVYIEKTGPYGNTKKVCEKMVQNSALNYMIIRPNYVYGIDKNNDFYRLYKIIRMTHLCPMIGAGRTKIQPVNKNDLAEITLKCMKKWKSKAEINVSGKTTISMNDIAEIIKKEANLRCTRIDVPIWILKPFKWIIPFDVDGYVENKVAPKGTAIRIGKADIKEDLKKMIKSV